ncbi:DegT/DnrJ/EryC1/StrS family aminotransferase [Haloferax sp. DFSO60]|uniref:DegT/DnrJ/EryC1/StrS family aminotransferase n=1 Tax=Haloferax sp. DFSO60 TaxID=3388652 RepID=UPI00397A397A
MIPLGSPQIDEQTVSRVKGLLESGLLSTGEVVSEFESEFCSLAGRSYGVGVSSGSVALEMALESVFDPGDAIAISPYNCGAVLYATLRADLEPVFVDAEPDTCCIDPQQVASVETELDGILVAHLFGQPGKMDRLVSVADELDATIIEDFAQAPGASYRGQPVGSFGEASVCSFGATKNLTTAEGGIIVTDNQTLSRQISSRRSNTSDTAFLPRSVRMNDIEAAIGVGQLRNYGQIVEQKRRVAEIYRDTITTGQLPKTPDGSTHVYHGFPLRHSEADELASHLEENDIGTSRLYSKPLHEYEASPITDESFSVAERLSDEVVLLPIHGGITSSEAETVSSIVNAY